MSMFSQAGFDFGREPHKTTNFGWLPKAWTSVIKNFNSSCAFLGMADLFPWLSSFSWLLISTATFTGFPKFTSLGSKNASIVLKVKQNVNMRRRFMMFLQFQTNGFHRLFALFKDIIGVTVFKNHQEYLTWSSYPDFIVGFRNKNKL